MIDEFLNVNWVTLHGTLRNVSRQNPLVLITFIWEEMSLT